MNTIIIFFELIFIVTSSLNQLIQE
jgi:hypothetical protein